MCQKWKGDYDQSYWSTAPQATMRNSTLQLTCLSQCHETGEIFYVVTTILSPAKRTFSYQQNSYKFLCHISSTHKVRLCVPKRRSILLSFDLTIVLQFFIVQQFRSVKFSNFVPKYLKYSLISSIETLIAQKSNILQHKLHTLIRFIVRCDVPKFILSCFY